VSNIVVSVGKDVWMARRALLLLAVVLAAGCGGHAGPSRALDSLLRGGGSAHFVLDGTIAAPAPIPVHAEGDLSPSALRTQGTALGLSGGVALRGRRLFAARKLLRNASWSGSTEQAHLELDVTREELDRLVPDGVPPILRRAHVTATVVFTSLNLHSSSEEGS
jgi:hypothetical protein